MLEITVCALLQ